MIRKVLKTLGILGAGAGAGAAVALLYAPQRGDRTRREIAKYRIRKLNEFRHLQHDVSSFVGGQVDAVRRGSLRLQKRIWSRAS